MNPLDVNSLGTIEGVTICLCMIVKNEASIIGRCLDSVKPYISSWVVVDTGSTDGTQHIVANHLCDLPGELHERNWVDFAHNRNEAMSLAQGKADYLMIIDADEVLNVWDVCNVGADVLCANVCVEGEIAPRVWLIRNGYPGQWVGAVHEDLEQFGTWCHAGGVLVTSYNDGARMRDPNSVNGDLRALFSMIQKEPKNPRHYYYLGATYMAAKAYEQAEQAFLIRLKMGGDATELERSERFLKQIQGAV